MLKQSFIKRLLRVVKELKKEAEERVERDPNVVISPVVTRVPVENAPERDERVWLIVRFC